LEFITGLTEVLTERAASLPLSTIENIGISIAECILLSLSLFLLLKYLLNRKSIRAAYPLVFFLLFITAGTIRDIIVRRTGEIIVYNTAGHVTVGIRTGKQLNSYADTLGVVKEVDRHKAMTGLKETKNLVRENALLRIRNKNSRDSLNSLSILITDKITNSIPGKPAPDIIILRGNNPVADNRVSESTRPRVLIIAPDVQRRSGIKSLHADSVHFVRNHGAFFVSL
ncbi:MAG: hypothetical protein GX876_06810, partial [Bacteroidales bacterium]|nr:hypothetical protein [Bacteroidales bacterium]